MLHPVLVLSWVLLRLISSAPLSSDSDSWSASSSDEDLQPPAVFPVMGVASQQAPPTAPEAPPRVIVDVKNTETNITLSFTIFIISEEVKEGSGTDGRFGSNTSSSESDDIIDDVNSEETKTQDIQPMTSLLPTETETSSQPMNKEHDDHMIITDEEGLSSKEMMSDQPMFTFSDEESDDFNNNTSNGKNWNNQLSLSDDFDYFINTSTEYNVRHKTSAFDDFDDFNNRTESREVSQLTVTFADYFGDRNNTRSEDITKQASDLASPPSDDFNNSTESTEINDEPERTILNYFYDKSTRSDEPTLFLSDDVSNSLSSEITELNQTLQGITLNTNNESTNSSQQEPFGTNTLDRLVLDPVSQEETSSSSEKTSLVNMDRVSSNRGNISKDFWFGSRLQEVFHSIHEVIDLLSGNQGVMGVMGNNHMVAGSTPNSLTGSQMGFRLSSDESDESSESVSFGKVSSDPKNQTSVNSVSDSNESLETISFSIQQGTGSRDSIQHVTGLTTSSSSDLISPDPDSKEVQDTSGKSIQVDIGAGLNPVSSDQDVAPTILSIQNGTVSKESRSFSHVNVSLNSDSSEESQESLGTREVVSLTTTSGPGLSRVSSPEVSSSSEEVMLAIVSSSSPLLVSSLVPSLQPPIESGHFSSESKESDSSDSGSKPDSPGLDSGNNSQSTELHPDPIPTSDSNLSKETNYNPSFGMNFSSSSKISQSEESPTLKIPTDANSDAIRGANPTIDYSNNTASIAASTEASMDAKLDSGVKYAEADLSSEARNDSSNDVSIEADPTTATLYSASLPSMHVSSGASTDATIGVEEDGDASTETTAETVVSMKPTTTSEYRTNLPESKASSDVEMEQAGSDVSTEANTDAKSPGANPHASSKENMASPLPPPPPPPRRKRPYRFGFLGPISHSYSNQPVAKETVSKERVASSHTDARETLAVKHHQNETPQQFNQHTNVYLNPFHTNSQYGADRERRPQVVSRQSSRKQTWVSVAAVANPAQSSSEETN